MQNIFENCLVYTSLRSPFARRVRVLLYEHGVSFTEKMVDVFKPQPELARLNPVIKIPTVVLSSGGILIDSSQIANLFYDVMPQSEFGYRTIEEKTDGSYLSGVAIGLMERLVEYYLETIRPATMQDKEILDEFRTFAGGATKVFADHLTQMTSARQSSFDVAIALDYLTLRYPGFEWQKTYPTLSEFLAIMRSRSAFLKTAPPP